VKTAQGLNPPEIVKIQKIKQEDDVRDGLGDVTTKFFQLELEALHRDGFINPILVFYAESDSVNNSYQGRSLFIIIIYL